jgi:hypothetical protein
MLFGMRCVISMEMSMYSLMKTMAAKTTLTMKNALAEVRGREGCGCGWGGGEEMEGEIKGRFLCCLFLALFLSLCGYLSSNERIGKITVGHEANRSRERREKREESPSIFFLSSFLSYLLGKLLSQLTSGRSSG